MPPAIISASKPARLKPVAPFDRDPAIAVMQAFDRDTGEPIDVSQLLTYAEALASYHVSPEDKFENGAPADVGPTKRRHLRIAKVGLIGKEANRVGDAGEEDPTSEAVVVFGAGGGGRGGKGGTRSPRNGRRKLPGKLPTKLRES